MAEHPNVELLRKGYAAFSQGDMQTVGELLSDDVVWHSPGNNPLAGDYKGKDQVFGLFAKLLEITEGTFHQEIHDLLGSDQHVVALMDEGWRKPKPFTGRSIHTWHVKGGKAAEFWLFNEDQAAADASFKV
jgi:ketosteroid isomerase-like protein